MVAEVHKYVHIWPVKEPVCCVCGRTLWKPETVVQQMRLTETVENIETLMKEKKLPIASI